MLPNIRLPLVKTKLTIMTVKRKNNKLRKYVVRRHRLRNRLSFSILIRSSSARGMSRVKSDSGRVDGCKEIIKQKLHILVLKLNYFVKT